MISVTDEVESFKLRKKGAYSTQRQPYSGIPTEEYTERNREKPWQRVPSPYILVLLGLYLLLGYLTQLVEDDMPRVVSDASINHDDWQTFSEESALRYLDTILGGKPRVAGTPFHLQKTRELKQLLDSIARQSRLPIRTDWQLATGDFWIEFAVPYVNYYQNASNIIAVLEGESGFNADGSTRSSLLVNCHYDSVPFAQGASDNGVFCAAMAELLRRLARRPRRFRHNIVFLFNGAEENPLQGSHAFLAHPWARGVTSVINLDSAGMNGKPSVFQVTDPRVLSEYRGTSRPSAQGVGEFLFMTGIIPSDTDFRIWRDFGDIQGIDIAFTKWGHVYHTRNDRPELLLPGVVQNAGNTLLDLVTGTADREDLGSKVPSSRMVYLDYLNMFMVSLTYTESQVADVFVALFALLTVLYYIWLVGYRWSTLQELLWSLLGRGCSLAAGAALPAVLLPVMVATTVQMRYLTHPWVVVPMFWIPFLVGTVAMAHVFDAWRTKKSGLNRSIRALQAMAATRLLLAGVLLLMSCARQASAVRYVVSLPLALSSAGALVSLTLVRYVRMHGWQHLALEWLLSAPALVFLVSLSLRLDATLLPTLARAGGSYPDYTAALVNVGMAVLCCTAVSGTELLFSSRRMWLPLGAALAGAALVMLLPLSPYSEDGLATQRHYWFHSEMVTYDAQKQPTSRTSGVLVTKHDPYTTSRVKEALAANNIHLNIRENFSQACATKVYCGLPLYRVAFGRFLSEALFLETNPPAPFTPAPDVSLLARSCAGNNCTYSFEVTVAPHNLLTLRPAEGATVGSWSLLSPPLSSFSVGGRPVYVILHSAATYSDTLSPLRFSVNMNVPESRQSQPALELVHHAHLAQHPELFTPEYSSLLQAMPRYFNIATFLSIRSDYVF